MRILKRISEYIFGIFIALGIMTVIISILFLILKSYELDKLDILPL